MDSLIQFFNGFSFEALDRLLFWGSPYPLYFILNCICICFILRKSIRKCRPGVSYIFGFSLVFVGKIALSLLFPIPNPIFKHPEVVLYFTIVWFSMNAFPYDLVFKILSWIPFSFIVQLIFTMLQVREVFTVTRVVYVNKMQEYMIVPIVLITVAAPQIIWMVCRLPKARWMGLISIIRLVFLSINQIALLFFGMNPMDQTNKSETMIRFSGLAISFIITFLTFVAYGKDHVDEFDVSLIVHIFRFLRK